MRVNVIPDLKPDPLGGVRTGNVYPVKGGRRSRYGDIMVVIAVTDPVVLKRHEYDCPAYMALCLVITREGEPVAVTQYLVSALEERVPIAFVDGLEDLDLVMRSI